MEQLAEEPRFRYEKASFLLFMNREQVVWAVTMATSKKKIEMLNLRGSYVGDQGHKVCIKLIRIL